MQNHTVKYCSINIESDGWGTLVVGNPITRVSVRLTYINDFVNDLCRLVEEISQKAEKTEIVWDAEPGVVRIICTDVAGMVNLNIRYGSDIFSVNFESSAFTGDLIKAIYDVNKGEYDKSFTLYKYPKTRVKNLMQLKL